MQANKSAIFSKVPEITLFFWIIKVLCTTVGETVADFLATNLNLGLTGTTIVMGIVLLGMLFFQFRSKRYVPAIYWLVVVLLSVFGTLITDNLVDNFGMSLVIATVLFGIALAATFVAWYMSEKTLSIHSIYTTKRELFYWLAILFTFALGTAAGDLMAERLGFGYLVTGLIICAAIAAVTVAWRFGLDEILGFWLVYIMTRPLGASLGDYLSQPQANGGLNLGPMVTSAIFLAAILAVVILLSLTRRDAIAAPEITPEIKVNRLSTVWQLVGVVVVLVVVSGLGYSWRSTQLATVRAANASAPSPLGDLSAFRTIAEDALKLVNSGDLAGAKTRVADIEKAWDSAQATLKAVNPDKWTLLDTDIDHVLTSLRASQPDAKTCSTSLQSMIDLVNTFDPHK
jgi:uncharacterized membrane-anchored protein